MNKWKIEPAVHEEFCLVGRASFDSQTSISISLFDTQIYNQVFWVSKEYIGQINFKITVDNVIKSFI